jgi:very-short-patch-repair endonuclease
MQDRLWRVSSAIGHPAHPPRLLLHSAPDRSSTADTPAGIRATRDRDDRRMLLTDEIRSLGGLAPTWQLHRRGHGRRELGAAVATGAVLRVRQGWYAVPSTPSHHLRAWRVGGRITCAIGARDHHLWTRLSDPPLHVSVTPDRSRLREPDDARRRLTAEADVHVHWTGDGRGTRFLSTPLRCLVDMADCEPTESVIAAADCALGLGLVTRRQWLGATSGLPAGMRLALHDIDPLSGSYLESIARVRLSRAGVRPKTQVQVTRGIRVDFLLGRVIIEIDGAGHGGLEQMRQDRERDLATRALGYRTLRYSGPQVLERWPRVLADIRAALAAG